MKFKDIVRIHVPSFTRISVCFFALSLVLKAIAVMFAPFADFFNRYIASLIRAAFAYITSVLPFSLAEAIIIMAVPISLIYLLYCAISASKKGKLPRHIFSLIGVICLLLGLFTVTFSIAYDCTPIEEKTELDTEEITPNDIYDACIIMIDEMNSLEPLITRNENGSVVMPYSFSEMSIRLNRSYARLCEEYSFISPLYVAPKRIALSKPLTYTGLAGIYTFFTGEANVNINFSDYAVTFTAAHEMAHQRGIAPEDEANFMAFLVCYTSDDPYIKYCALAEGANYLSNTLYETDMELFGEVAEYFSDEAVGEYTAYVENYAPYANSSVGEITDGINDVYLKSQGQKEGVKSYSLVTTLATAYILKTHK